MSRFIHLHFYEEGGFIHHSIINNKVRLRVRHEYSFFFSFFQKSASVIILRLLGTKPQTRPKIIIIAKSLRKQ